MFANTETLNLVQTAIRPYKWELLIVLQPHKSKMESRESLHMDLTESTSTTGHERQSRQHYAELTTFKLAEALSLSLWSHCNWHSHMAAATPVSLILGVWAVWAILEKRQTERDRQRHFHPPGSMKDPPNVAWRDDFWKKTTKKDMNFHPNENTSCLRGWVGIAVINGDFYGLQHIEWIHAQ